MIKKRIVFFIESFSGGGAERVLLTILRNINLQRFDVTVLVMCDTGVYSKDFHKLDVKIISVIGSKLPLFDKIKYKLLYQYLSSTWALKWILKGIKADTYIAFIEGYCTKIFAALPQSFNKIAWVHTDLKSFPWPIEKCIFQNKKEEQRAYHKFKKVIGVSQLASNVMREHYDVQAETLYNPIDEKRIISLAQNGELLKVDKSKFNIISIGRLTHAKGYDKLLEIMPDLVVVNPNIKLYIIGEGEERRALEKQIDQLGISGHVTLTGFMSNPYSLMSKMDLFVCSSRAEGFSLVIAEAMITGLPVVSMDCAGPNELLGYGQYGKICKSYEELRDSIIELSINADKLKVLCEASKERAKFFNTQNIIQQIEAIL